MKIFTLLIVLFSLSAAANEVVWKAGKVFVSLYEDKKKNLLYSSNCQKSKCDAIEKTKKLSWKDMREDATAGGKNPGAVLCKEVLNQKIVYLKDLQGNENTFCLFPDNSIISSSSLAVIATKNEKKK